MADKAESQSSLFAGMNMGEIRQSRTSTSSSHHVKMDTKFAEGRNIKGKRTKNVEEIQSLWLASLTSIETLKMTLTGPWRP